jgi:hypothetical protein
MLHGFKARGAEAVDLHAGRGFGIIGIEHGDAGDVAALFPNRRHAAEHHVIDIGGVDPGAVAHRLQHLGAELDRA